MRFELPPFKRCCFCVPLRRGILIYGYLNVAFSLFVIGIQIRFDTTQAYPTHNFLYRGVSIDAANWFIYLLYVMEAIFNIVLLVGAHGKLERVIQVYYYYGISSTVAAFFAFLVAPFYGPVRHWYLMPMLCLAFVGLVLQCYLLLIIRSELKKLQYQGGPLRYVRNTPEVFVELSPPGGRDHLSK